MAKKACSPKGKKQAKHGEKICGKDVGDYGNVAVFKKPACRKPVKKCK